MVKVQNSSRGLSARSWILVLLMVLTLTRLQPAAFGDSGCFDKCQAALVQCLAAAQGNQTEEARCQDQYDACGEACQL
jgi:hypothetical protein